MRIHFISLLLFLGLESLTAQTQSPAAVKQRTWTSSEGRKLEGTFQATEGTSVRIRLSNGSVVTVPLDRFSAEDVAYVEQQSASAAPTGPPTAAKEWPRSVSLEGTPESEVITEDSAKKEFIYRSEHYEFRCDSKLTSSLVREFSRIFEATYLLNCTLPLDLKPTPEEGQEYFVARLFTTKEDYFANGGVEGSGGVYRSGEKALFVPLSSLGVKLSGSRVVLEKSSDDDNTTLIHEITHQMMNHWLGKLRTWYVEGSAEAIEMLEYQRGGFSLANPKARLKNYLERQRSDGKSFVMLDPQELFEIEGRAWALALVGVRGQATQNYASACLMTYYFYYLDDKGDAAHMIAYLRDLENANRDAEAAAFEKHLLRGRSMDQLKEDLTKAFRSEGVALTFDPKGKNSIPSSP